MSMEVSFDPMRIDRFLQNANVRELASAYMKVHGELEKLLSTTTRARSISQ